MTEDEMIGLGRMILMPRHGVDPDPPRCWSCGHPFGAGCECTCCNDDHSEEPSPHE